MKTLRAVRVPVYDGAYNTVPCESTFLGWVWHCEPHGTHGNADSEDEAYQMRQAHVAFWDLNYESPECVVTFGHTTDDETGDGHVHNHL